MDCEYVEDGATLADDALEAAEIMLEASCAREVAVKLVSVARTDKYECMLKIADSAVNRKCNVYDVGASP